MTFWSLPLYVGEILVLLVYYLVFDLMKWGCACKKAYEDHGGVSDAGQMVLGKAAQPQQQIVIHH